MHPIEGAMAMTLLLDPTEFAAASRGRRYTLYSAATVVIMLSFGGWSATEIPRVEAGLPTPWVGVKECIHWHSYPLWHIALAIRPLREPSATSRCATPPSTSSRRAAPHSDA